MTLAEKLAQRAKLLKESRAILDKAEEEKREMTGEEEGSYEKIYAEAEGLTKSIEAYRKQAEAERALAETVVPETRETTEAKPEEAVRKTFDNFLRNGVIGGEGEAELRAMQLGDAAQAGYLVSPEEFVKQLIQTVNDMTFMRGVSTIKTLNGAHSLGFPTLNTKLSNSQWGSEIQSPDQNNITVGKRALKANYMSTLAIISRPLLAQSSGWAGDIVINDIARSRSETEEQAFMTGDGVAQPLGVFVASTDGISTARDVSTGSATNITFDGLKDAKYNQKSQYWAAMKWLFGRTAMKNISKLKDGNGQYLWQMSNQAGEPDRLLGLPIMMSEFVPSTFTASQYVGMLADFSHYWIVDSLQLQIQRLEEKYALTNQTGFVARAQVDGAPVLNEAFTRLKTAAS